MSPVVLVVTLVAGVLITGGIAIWREAKSQLGAWDYRWLALVLTLACIARAPSEGKFFLGLEYEDAYVFTAASRYLLYPHSPSAEPFRARTCVVGSLADCQWDATPGGHFLPVPALALVSHRLFGYSPYAIPWINYSVSVASVLVLFLFCRRLSTGFAGAVAASVIYAVSPAMSAFHTSGLAETFSSFVVLLHGFAIAILFREPDCGRREEKVLLWALLCSSLLLAILTKRENLVVGGLAVLALALAWWRREPHAWQRMAWLGVATGISIWAAGAAGMRGIEASESGDIGARTFSFEYSLALVPVFARALLTVKWFVGLGALCLVGMVTIWARRLTTLGVLLPAYLSFAYLAVYTAHYRSYYFVVHGLVNPFEALRYITNAFPWFAIVAGVGVAEASRWLRLEPRSIGRVPRVATASTLTLWVLGSLWMARALRSEWVSMEWENRVRPVVSSLAEMGSDPRFLLTDLAIVAQVFGDSHVRLIDAQSVGSTVEAAALSQALRRVAGAGWWLRRNDDALDRQRYPALFGFVDEEWLVGGCRAVSEWYSLCDLGERATSVEHLSSVGRAEPPASSPSLRKPLDGPTATPSAK